MKKTITVLTIILLVIFMVGCENSVNPIQPQTQNDNDGISLAKKGAGKCADIQSGTIVYSAGHYLAGEPLELGFDIFGYNYQGMMFKGSYYNSYAGGDGYGPWTGDDEAYLAEFPAAAGHWAWPYRDIKLAMKWNEAWISKTDCDGDGTLDRHWGYPTYDNSGAWLTNHQSGENWCGGTKDWNYFVKIITPSTANGDYTDSGVWYDKNGVEIGPVIWGAFAIVMQVSNDECLDENGQIYISPKSAGLGVYKPF